MTIRDLHNNSEAVFTGSRNYSHDGLKKLQSMGLQKGSKIRVKRIQGRNIILQVEELGVELVIDKELAGEMEVS
ncbi:MAG: ferrous iron transport protein A [Deltaproteobacteria bacterium]